MIHGRILIYLLLTVCLTGPLKLLEAADTDALSQIRKISKSEYFVGEGHNYEIFLHDFNSLTYLIEALGSLIETRMANNIPLNGYELNLMGESIKAYLHLTTQAKGKIYGLRKLRSERYSPVLFQDPQNYLQDLKEVKLRAKKVETTQLIFSAYFSHQQIRLAIEGQAKWEGNGIANIRSRAQRIVSRDQVLLLSDSYRSLVSNHRKLLKDQESRVQVLAESFFELNSYQYYILERNLDAYTNLDSVIKRTNDRLAQGFDGLTRILSWGFGSIAGNIQWRSGYLKNNQELLDMMNSKLKPFDILFEKKKFLLTDKTIPGHWGHVGIWIGTEQQWRTLGIWDNPKLAYFQEMIEQGHYIFQVRRWGIEFDTAETFSNLDEIAALRVSNLVDPSYINEQMAIEIFQRLEDQVGKKYDFAFDAMATNRIICTELITLAYGPIEWPSDKQLGRYTITPDHMGRLLLYKNSPLEFVFYATAESDKVLVKHTKRDFARDLNFFENKHDGLFYEKTQECENNIRRNRGQTRVDRRCQYVFTPFSYEYDLLIGI